VTAMVSTGRREVAALVMVPRSSRPGCRYSAVVMVSRSAARAGEAMTCCTLSMGNRLAVMNGSDLGKSCPSLCHFYAAKGQCHPQRMRAIFSQAEKTHLHIAKRRGRNLHLALDCLPTELRRAHLPCLNGPLIIAAVR
jgi:hypothetical protein